MDSNHRYPEREACFFPGRNSLAGTASGRLSSSTPGTGILQTHRWREMDSDHRSPVGTAFPAEIVRRFGPDSPLEGDGVEARSAAECTGQPPGVFRWRVTDAAAGGSISAHQPSERSGS